ncbi:MAG: NCS2 family permease [Spirochaetaceae bacterium]|jgi:AGZA family xanthine/uracil permease-like MFS transporter|nr:NCS2 family permease [Spirochaetaceae bacterium]
MRRGPADITVIFRLHWKRIFELRERGDMDRFFSISGRGSTIPREIVAGFVTFASMVYILAVHPGIMTAAGMDYGRTFTSTAISAGVATIVMAVVGRLPVALACGLGLNAYVAYTVCGVMGFNWQTALAAVFVEGALFIVLSLSGAREKIINAIPEELRRAVAAGIGLFIAVIGLQNGGILAVGGGTPIAINPVTSGAPLVTVLGFAILLALYVLRVPGSVFIAVIAATIIGIPLGVTDISGFSIVGLPPAPYTPLDIIRGLKAVSPLDFAVVFSSLLFVDLFDTVSCFSAVALQSKLLDKNGNILNLRGALLADAIGTAAGSLIGATTVTSYIESSTGIAVGGRTGLASLVTGILFLLALVLAPLFAVIPGAATAPALIFVGYLMLGTITGTDLAPVEVGAPFFVTMLLIPMSYSISTGLAWGFVTWALVMTLRGKAKAISPVAWFLTALFLVKIIWLKA